MILFAVNQGLQIEEVITITYKQFKSKFFDVQLFSILGKTDMVPVNMVCWEDHYTPELPGVQLLLLWIRLARKKSGYLFPCLEELLDPDNRVNGAVNHYPYYHLLKDLKYLSYDICGVIHNIKRIIGSHSCRKTYALYAAWGNHQDIWSNDRLLRCATIHGLLPPYYLAKDLRQKTWRL